VVRNAMALSMIIPYYHHELKSSRAPKATLHLMPGLVYNYDDIHS